MDKDRKRAERRAEVERLKKKRCNYWGFASYREEMDERRLGMVVSTPKPCDCWRCSKPHKHELTISEISDNQAAKLQEFDLDSNE